jgi:hypothetical protein
MTAVLEKLSDYKRPYRPPPVEHTVVVFTRRKETTPRLVWTTIPWWPYVVMELVDE